MIPTAPFTLCVFFSSPSRIFVVLVFAADTVVEEEYDFC